MEENERKRERPASAANKPMHERRNPASADAANERASSRPAGTGVRSAPKGEQPVSRGEQACTRSAKPNPQRSSSEALQKPRAQQQGLPAKARWRRPVWIVELPERDGTFKVQRTQPSEAPKKQPVRVSDQAEQPKAQRTQHSEAPKKQPKQTNEQTGTPKKRKSDLFYSAFGLLVKIGWIVLSLFLILQFVVGAHKNVGVGMEPSFHDRDIVFYNRLKHDYQTGDVVVFKGQNDTAQIGRIVAAGGDTVEIEDGALKLNGYFQTEPYAKGETVRFEGAVAYPMTLGRDEYFILFDNRGQGGDSRTLGAISAGEIKGHVILTIRARDF